MFGKRSNRLRTLSIAAALFVAVVFVIWESLGRELTARSQTGYAATGTSSLLQTATAKLEVELVTLRASGFEPLEIKRPKGPFILLVDDRSGKERSSLALQRAKGERVRGVNTDRMKSEWHDVVDLPPGDYLLTNAESSSACHIVILP